MTAYKAAKALEAHLPTLLAAPGRPANPPAAPASSIEYVTLVERARDFLIAHPGSATGKGRHLWSDAYRAFVLGLVDAHPELPASEIAGAAAVPWPTLRDGLRPPGLRLSPSRQPRPAPQSRISRP